MSNYKVKFHDFFKFTLVTVEINGVPHFMTLPEYREWRQGLK